jgi:hypothetical protein
MLSATYSGTCLVIVNVTNYRSEFIKVMLLQIIFSIFLVPNWNAQYHFPFRETDRGFHLASRINAAPTEAPQTTTNVVPSQRNGTRANRTVYYVNTVVLGGLVVVSVTGPKVRGFKSG